MARVLTAQAHRQLHAIVGRAHRRLVLARLGARLPTSIWSATAFIAVIAASAAAGWGPPPTFVWTGATTLVFLVPLAIAMRHLPGDSDAAAVADRWLGAD